MSFVYLFDLLDFDVNGCVCESKHADLSHARSNFLYLISKYNQMMLQEEKLPVPAFFKEELGFVLADVENGGNFETAKNKVVENCLPSVQLFANLNEKEMVGSLSEKVSIKDVEFSQKVKKSVNNVQLGYIITQNLGKVFNKICALQVAEQSKENKSSLYKQIIKYNSLTSVAEKVSKNDFSKDKLVKMVG